MTILFILLKWIAILVLVLLALFILLLTLVLFVPVRYDILLIYERHLSYRFRIHWCFHIVTCKKKMNTDLIKLYIFGIPIRTISGEAELQKKDSGEMIVNRKTEKNNSEDSSDDNKKVHEETHDRKDSKNKSAPHDKLKKKTGNKNRDKKTKTSWREKLRFQFHRISGIIKFAYKRENKKVFRMLWNELVSIIKYVFPGKVWGSAEFGTGDPAATGLVLGVISLFPWAYIKKLSIVPNFEEKVLKGNIGARGRIRMFHLVRLAWRLYRSKEMKRTIREWKRINKT